MKRGFTLVELLAVLVLISLLALFTVPSIINYINGSKDDISDVTKELIYSGAKLYVDSNPNKYIKVVDNQFCVILNDIVKANYLSAPILDGISGEEVDVNKFVKINYVHDDELDYNKYVYEIVDTCEENIKSQ